ncbi:hypothetical protein, partial [Streptomyces mirabilis]
MARQRMHTLLNPKHLASDAEVRVLEDAGIPLLSRPQGGRYIDPAVQRVSEAAAMPARVESAT